MGFFSSPKNADGDDEPSQSTVRYCSLPAAIRDERKKRLERNRNRTDLLNSFAKFSPASVHAELLDVCPPTSPSVRDILSKSYAPAAVRVRSALGKAGSGRVVIRGY